METRRIYITAEEGRTFSFPYDWKQTFDHPFEMSRAVNEAQIVKTYVSEEADRQIGLEVLKLLFDFTFATRDQLERLLRIKASQRWIGWMSCLLDIWTAAFSTGLLSAHTPWNPSPMTPLSFTVSTTVPVIS